MAELKTQTDREVHKRQLQFFVVVIATKIISAACSGVSGLAEGEAVGS